MPNRHARQSYYIVDEGVRGPELARSDVRCATSADHQNMYRFSRLAPIGEPLPQELLVQVAAAMTQDVEVPSSSIPAGFTYLGQFIDHDLTQDKSGVTLGSDVDPQALVHVRSPVLDLDSLYGFGPKLQSQFYAADGMRLKLGDTLGSNFPVTDPVAGQSVAGFDLPRGTIDGRNQAEIPEPRNDENLAIAQLHVAFARFHNHVVDRCVAAGASHDVFAQARAEVVKHYQTLIRDEYLPRICQAEVVRNVFDQGRKLFEPDQHGPSAVMPIEFSAAAFRLGHSMVRRSYDWNRIFRSDGPAAAASPQSLLAFSGMSGGLTPPGGNAFDALPTSWTPNWLGLFDFRVGAASPFPGNRAERINTLLTPLLAQLPPGAFGGIESGRISAPLQRHLAFRNLMRANMLRLASGQQVAALLRSRGLAAGATVMNACHLLANAGCGADLSGLSAQHKERFTLNTPLWFYTLREAEVIENGERLGPLGSQIVVETLHRAMEGSRNSIIRDVAWRPTLGREGRFGMCDLLAFAFPEGLNHLG